MTSARCDLDRRWTRDIHELGLLVAAGCFLLGCEVAVSVWRTFVALVVHAQSVGSPRCARVKVPQSEFADERLGIRALPVVAAHPAA